MKHSQLNMGLGRTITGIFLLLFITACNNSDKPGNNSTTEASSDTTTITSTNTPGNDASDTSNMGTRTTPGKRKTKITIAPPAIDKTVAIKTDDGGFYNYTETAPVFPGGQSSLENYINRNIEYPEDAIDNEKEGTVYVLFTIDESGKVGNVKTTGTKLGYGLEEEAIRVINGMSNWTPGLNKGKKVKAWYTLPVTYKLEE